MPVACVHGNATDDGKACECENPAPGVGERGWAGENCTIRKYAPPSPAPLPPPPVYRPASYPHFAVSFGMSP